LRWRAARDYDTFGGMDHADWRVQSEVLYTREKNRRKSGAVEAAGGKQ
jgi:hypothetical protein